MERFIGILILVVGLAGGTYYLTSGPADTGNEVIDARTPINELSDEELRILSEECEFSGNAATDSYCKKAVYAYKTRVTNKAEAAAAARTKEAQRKLTRPRKVVKMPY